MENENQTSEQAEVIETKQSPLHTVTPLSKYLAMALFIILPFLGGWIGYTYAPEKVVEVEKVVLIEKETSQKVEAEKTSKEILETNFPALARVNVGDSFGAFTVDAVELDTFTPFFGANGAPYVIEDGRHTVLVTYSGTTSLSGNIYLASSLNEEGKTAGTPYSIAFKPTLSEMKKIPLIDGFSTEEKYKFITIAGLENHPFVLNTINATGCSIEDEQCAFLALREPIESGEITITIAGFRQYSQTWPSGAPSFPVTTLVE